MKINSISKPLPQKSTLETSVKKGSYERQVSGSSHGEKQEFSSSAKKYVKIGRSGPIARPSPIGSNALESVIGTDSRQKISITELVPWRKICALKLFSNSGSAIGTGWLAGPRTIITAGHCVHYQDFFGGWADEIQISPGRDGGDFPFKTITSSRFSALDRWVNHADPDFDIGCIHLDEPIGEEVGWFSFGVLPAEDLESHLVNISGYPRDRGNGTEQYFHFNRVLRVTERRIFYDVDTAGGQSGAPVWIQEDDESDPIVVGIHAYGVGGTSEQMGIVANSAPRIIPEVFDILTKWIDDDI